MSKGVKLKSLNIKFPNIIKHNPSNKLSLIIYLSIVFFCYYLYNNNYEILYNNQ